MRHAPAPATTRRHARLLAELDAHLRGRHPTPTPDDILSFIGSWVLTKAWSAGTLDTRISSLKAACRADGRRWPFADADPRLAALRKARAKAAVQPAVAAAAGLPAPALPPPSALARPEMRHFTMAQLADLCRAADDRPTPGATMAALCACALTTGQARVHELLWPTAAGHAPDEAHRNCTLADVHHDATHHRLIFRLVGTKARPAAVEPLQLACTCSGSQLTCAYHRYLRAVLALSDGLPPTTTAAFHYAARPYTSTSYRADVAIVARRAGLDPALFTTTHNHRRSGASAAHEARGPDGQPLSRPTRLQMGRWSARSTTLESNYIQTSLDDVASAQAAALATHASPPAGPAAMAPVPDSSRSSSPDADPLLPEHPLHEHPHQHQHGPQPPRRRRHRRLSPSSD